jgi:predicted metal-dependent hydrolase
MGRFRLQGNPPIDIELRRSTRARRLSLRVSQLDGKVTLTLPARLAEREAIAFAEDRADWIRGHLDRIEDTVLAAFGAQIPIEGHPVTLVPGPGRKPERSDATLALPDDPSRVGARVQGFLKTLARERLAQACDRHSAMLGRPFGRLSLRDTRSRWGSCTSRGDLMFSWRLVMAPPEILDYVAAHEVAHLAEHNHSRAFWDVCRALCPDYAHHRAWLRREGPSLHRYRFD